MKMKILMPTGYYDEAHAFLKEKGYEIIDCPSTATPDERKAAMADCDAIIARTEKYTPDMIDSAPKLKIIARAGVGFENVPIDYCTEKNVWVTFTPLANYIPVAEHSLGLMLSLAHKIPHMDSNVRKGNWAVRDKEKGREVYGKTLGIIGFGRIGRKFAEMAHYGLDMKIIAFDSFIPKEQFPDYCQVEDNMDNLLAQADFVSVHIPSTPETINMVNLDFCKKMKNSAYIINCARGNIVNEKELYEALKSNVISGAAVDVMEKEPTLESPLFELDNFIATPHFAALNHETIDRMGQHAAECVDLVLSGKEPTWPLNKIHS